MSQQPILAIPLGTPLSGVVNGQRHADCSWPFHDWPAIQRLYQPGKMFLRTPPSALRGRIPTPGRISSPFLQYTQSSFSSPLSAAASRGLTDSAGERPTTMNADSLTLPSRVLAAAVPFVPKYGFSTATLLAGVGSAPELSRLAIGHWTLTGLFPSSTSIWSSGGTGFAREPMGPAKALAQEWIAQGNEHMKSMIRKEKLTLQKNGLEGVRRAFEVRLAYNRTIPHGLLLQALALTATPIEPFFGIQLPVELPHILPYGSHALEVATVALAGLQDYSKSREWMLRRIRLAAVWSAIELTSIGDRDQPISAVSTQLQALLDASETAATRVGDTVEFLGYVGRSQRAIVQSLGLL